MRLLPAVLLSVPLLAGPTTAIAAVAPGRVTFPVSAADTFATVDPSAAGPATLAPDGTLVTVGVDAATKRLAIARVGADGRVRGAVARVSVPVPTGYVGPYPTAVALDDAGRLLVLTDAPARGRTTALAVSRILPDGRRDPSFGQNGTVVTGLESGGAMALTGDRVVVCGSLGKATACRRFTADGVADPAFADGLAGSGVQSTSVVQAFADGRLALLGFGAGGAPTLVVLRADGTRDPSWPAVALPAGARDGLVARADGSVDVLVAPSTTAPATVRRYRAGGTLDPSFGTKGSVSVAPGGFDTTLVAGPGGTDVVVGRSYGEPNVNFFSTVRVTRLQPDGTPDPAWGGAEGTVLAPGVGGGLGTFRAVIRLPQVGPLRQNGLAISTVLPRPDGGLVIVGSAMVTQYTGEGEGFSHDEAAVAAFGPDLRPDAAFGGPAAPARVRVTVPAQRLRRIASVAQGRAVRVRLSASGAGMARITVRARGVVVAQAIAPVFRPAGQTAFVWFTKDGRRLLGARARPPIAVTVSVRLRDLVQEEAVATARGVLR